MDAPLRAVNRGIAAEKFICGEYQQFYDAIQSDMKELRQLQSMEEELQTLDLELQQKKHRAAVKGIQETLDAARHSQSSKNDLAKGSSKGSVVGGKEKGNPIDQTEGRLLQEEFDRKQAHWKERMKKWKVVENKRKERRQTVMKSLKLGKEAGGSTQDWSQWTNEWRELSESIRGGNIKYMDKFKATLSPSSSAGCSSDAVASGEGSISSWVMERPELLAKAATDTDTETETETETERSTREHKRPSVSIQRLDDALISPTNDAWQTELHTSRLLRSCRSQSSDSHVRSTLEVRRQLLDTRLEYQSLRLRLYLLKYGATLAQTYCHPHDLPLEEDLAWFFVLSRLLRPYVRAPLFLPS
jgi:hypothetical protein